MDRWRSLARMDLVAASRRRVEGCRSAPGSGVPSAGRSPISSGSSASTGRAPTARRCSSPATPLQPRTSPRRRSWLRCATSTGSTGADRSLRGCIASSSTARSTGRAPASCAPRSSSATSVSAPHAPEPDGAVLGRIGDLAPEHRAVVVLRYVLEYTPGRDRRAARPAARHRQLAAAARPRPAEGAGGVNDVEERTWEVVRRAYEERAPRTAGRRGSNGLLLAGLAAAVGVAAAVLSPPGRAVFERVREAVGVEHAAPALFSLPASGRLLVVSAERRRRVARARRRPQATARLLRGRRLVAARPLPRRVADRRAGRGHRRRATSAGRSRATASATRPGKARGPTRGSPTSQTSGLRVVAGDGTGDHLLDRHAQDVAPAWDPAQPARRRLLRRVGAVVLRRASGPVLWRAPVGVLPDEPRVVLRRPPARGRLRASASSSSTPTAECCERSRCSGPSSGRPHSSPARTGSR